MDGGLFYDVPSSEVATSNDRPYLYSDDWMNLYLTRGKTSLVNVGLGFASAFIRLEWSLAVLLSYEGLLWWTEADRFLVDTAEQLTGYAIGLLFQNMTKKL